MKFYIKSESLERPVCRRQGLLLSGLTPISVFKSLSVSPARDADN